MDQATHNRIISFIWDIADAVLRDLFKRGKYEPDAWVNNDATKIGYEVSVTRHFYKPQPLRILAEISADILAVEKEAEGLLDGLLVAKAEA